MHGRSIRGKPSSTAARALRLGRSVPQTHPHPHASASASLFCTSSVATRLLPHLRIASPQPASSRRDLNNARFSRQQANCCQQANSCQQLNKLLGRRRRQVRRGRPETVRRDVTAPRSGTRIDTRAATNMIRSFRAVRAVRCRARRHFCASFDRNRNAPDVRSMPAPDGRPHTNKNTERDGAPPPPSRVPRISKTTRRVRAHVSAMRIEGLRSAVDRAPPSRS